MWMCEMHTEHYDWLSFGDTEKEAKAVLVKEWNDSPMRERSTFKQLDEYYGINVTEVKSGTCLVS